MPSRFLSLKENNFNKEYGKILNRAPSFTHRHTIEWELPPVFLQIFYAARLYENSISNKLSCNIYQKHFERLGGKRYGSIRQPKIKSNVIRRQAKKKLESGRLQSKNTIGRAYSPSKIRWLEERINWRFVQKKENKVIIAQ